MLSMGKSTISMAIFNSKLLVNYRRVISMAMGQYGPCVDRWNIQEIESLKDVLEVLQGWAKHEAGWSSPRDPRLAVVAKRGAEVERLPLLGGLEHEWTEWIICPIIMGIVTPTSSSSIISSIYHPYIYIYPYGSKHCLRRYLTLQIIVNYTPNTSWEATWIHMVYIQISNPN